MEENINLLDINLNADAFNPSQLAYIGDAVYEIYIRYYLLYKGISKSSMLSQKAEFFVKAQTQSKALKEVLNMLNEEEKKAVLRGRNSKHKNKPANATVEEYNNATGLEALIGYLYLKKQKNRLNDIIVTIIKNANEIERL